MPVFGERVSPRFDCAASFLVADVQDGRIVERHEFQAVDWAPHERINRLVQLGVNTVICGGIDRWSAESLRSVGITLYGWISGSIEDTLAALLRGDLHCEAALPAGESPSRFRDGCRCRDDQPDAPALEGRRRGGRRRAGRHRGGPDRSDD
jgi:predicted Fe-Mo cluster-binding NifX family protein